MSKDQLSKTPPKGVSTKVMWRQLVGYKRKAAKSIAKAKEIGDTLTEVGIGGGVALGSGVLFAKYPQAKRIPGISALPLDTDVVGAMTALVFALTGSKMSSAALEVAKGLGYPALSRLGAEKIAPKLG